MAGDFQVGGTNASALFTLKLHRGDGMSLVAMNWKDGKPPNDFVGFGIEYMEPGGNRFFALKNRLGFPDAAGEVDPNAMSTLRSPIQKFRWVHFPRNADLPGEFVYRVTPVFMNAADELSYGEPQEAAIELRRDTYPRRLNVAFTRGFVSSQAFVDRYESAGPVSKLLPGIDDEPLTFVPSHPKAGEALPWMGFEARAVVLALLDEAIADKQAQVRVVAYDLNVPDIVARLEKLGPRLKVIIDDDGSHGKADSGETQAAARLAASAGAGNVKRQHMGQLQHNKTLVVDGPKVRAAVCGSTNYSWRGLYVQANNAIVIRGKKAIKPFRDAFDAYWDHDSPADFGATPSAGWNDLGLAGIDARVAFSPHAAGNALLDGIAADVATTTSSLFFSLAFLYQTPGAILDAINQVTKNDEVFVYGMSDRKVGGIEILKPDGTVAVVRPAELAGKSVPEPFKSEPTGGSGVRLHHKFVVIDFDQPTARVYMGSYNFSKTADTKNGENLLLIRDRRIAVAYVVEALRLFDHYHFRVAQKEAKTAKKQLLLARPPRLPGEKPWWAEDWSNPRKARDRELFA